MRKLIPLIYNYTTSDKAYMKLKFIKLFIFLFAVSSIIGMASANGMNHILFYDSDRPSIIQDNNGIYWIAFNSYTNLKISG